MSPVTRQSLTSRTVWDERLRTAPRFATKKVAVEEVTQDAAVLSAPSLTPHKMNERIFNLNKLIVDGVYSIICLLYPVTGKDRDFARFYVLETVARVPYFAYLSVLHLRETFGERNLGDKMRTHYAEADNE